MSVWSIPKRNSYRPDFIQILISFLVFCFVLAAVFVFTSGAFLLRVQKTAPVHYGSVSQTNLATMDVFDVGQGSAALLRFSDGKTMLVDTGPPSSKNKLLTYLNERDVTAIDCMVITHQHGDHAGNVSAVLNFCTVRDVFLPAAPSNLYVDQDRVAGIYADIASHGLTIHNPDQGQVILSGNGYSVTVLSDDRGQYKTLNEYSIVLRVIVGDISFLMTGDAEGPAEQALLHSGADLKSDVLLVGHHGNKNAASIPFLEAVKPVIAVISVGENKFGQPYASVINRLIQENITILRTDRDKTITFTTDGNSLKTDNGVL